MIILMILIVLIIQYFHKVRTYLISLCHIYMYIFDSCSFLISYRELEHDPSLQHVRGGLLCQTYPLAKSVCSTFCWWILTAQISLLLSTYMLFSGILKHQSASSSISFQAYIPHLLSCASDVFFCHRFFHHVGRSFLLFEAVASSGDACRKTLIWRFQDGKRGRLLFFFSFLFLKQGCQRRICISLKGLKRQTSKVIMLMEEIWLTTWDV